jgi:uncharacterized glyoxalase superfamily protein PhnB
MIVMETPVITMGKIVPILRIFDEAKAREFYLDFLDFQLVKEHRFEEGLPLYMQVAYGECLLHLSEHHGDCSPGAAIRIQVSNIEAYHANLLAKKYKFARPGLEETPWNSREVTVGDPFGNRIIFYQHNS